MLPHHYVRSVVKVNFSVFYLAVPVLLNLYIVSLTARNTGCCFEQNENLRKPLIRSLFVLLVFFSLKYRVFAGILVDSNA